MIRHIPEEFWEFADVSRLLPSFYNSHIPVILTPLNAAKADEVVSTLLSLKRECVLIAPIICIFPKSANSSGILLRRIKTFFLKVIIKGLAL